jgi:hypothetical protein
MAAARTVFRNHTHYFVKSRQTIHAAKAQRTHPAKKSPHPLRHAKYKHENISKN